MRHERRLTQEELGRRLRRDRLQIIRWEHQGIAPSPRRLVALAKVLGVSPWELTTITPEVATLADLRSWAGLSQAQLAERAGMVRSTYAALERGELSLRPDITARIAKGLGKATKPADVEAAYHRARTGTTDPPGASSGA